VSGRGGHLCLAENRENYVSNSIYRVHVCRYIITMII
jgi:hypothetical protein